MKRYGQFCAVARALDLVGDRWTLLIARELLLRPCRFGELVDGLPGIPRNLLAERLRTLAGHGLVHGDGGRYELTERGEELRPVIDALAAFGVPEMGSGQGDDVVRGRWIATAVQLRFGGDPGVRVVEAGESEVVIDRHGEELRGTPAEVMRELTKDLDRA